MPEKKKCKSYPIGYCHLDIAEVQTEEGTVYLFVGIDREVLIYYTGGALPLQTTLAGD